MARTIRSNVETLRNYIGGRWVDAQATETQPVHNPATNEVIAQVPRWTRRYGGARRRSRQDADRENYGG